MSGSHADASNMFSGKVAIVSGGASGIGLATANLLAELGARVIATDIAGRPDGLGRTVDFMSHDVTDRDAWRAVGARTVAALGHVDILVNCVGVLSEGNLKTTSLAEWRRVIAINVEGTFNGCQAIIPLMPPSGGSIVNMASVSGSRGDANLIAYTASKGAVVMLTREVALDCARRGTNIRCNSVSPGVVDTAMIADFFAARPSATLPEWLASQPVARTIAPAEVAELIVFLSGPEASFVTGADFPIDCGASA
ncbi:MAG: SDR family oxidoreductase [Rhizobiaceae bacterium]|nr:SDR family oxidoreductase [Rhizobiaceae bacterium]